MKRKILLVDDEKDLLMLMARRISTWGYSVIEAENGKEAIDAVKEKKPDIMILDYMLPDMDGIAALKEIRKINSTIPVIMFTAFPDKRSIEGTEELGINAVIPKLSMFTDTQAALKTSLEMAEKSLGKGE